MIELLLASMLFATIPQLNVPALTVYADPVAVEEDVDHFARAVKMVDDINTTVDDNNENVDNSCMHSVYVDIIEEGGGYFAGLCECGEVVRWYESDGEDLEDEEDYMEDDENPACEWVEDGRGGLDCIVHGCHAELYYGEVNDDGDYPDSEGEID